ncbi:hypothetical protein FWG95_03875 [Candidatus Saccharibacteria bacterium]|nr:hypothetical protein [Candidatus Saccharibacteria bacterium]
MKLHNTLTKKVDDFTPLDPASVRVYSCGPTVYNHAHIGNLSAYIYSDILHRTLILIDHSVQRVMNLTDVDDKTIRDSRTKYPDLEPMEALIKFTRHYEGIFLREMCEVGNLVDEVQFERATDNIAEMQRLILKLLREGIAYLADDGIYFSISEYSKTRKYGQLSKIEVAKDREARINNDEYDKDTASDFALWKRLREGEPSWNFWINLREYPESIIHATQLGDWFREARNTNSATVNDSDFLTQKSQEGFTLLSGRPGWHIECSAMSVKNLGQPFDIHTGGVDHIFPHHENEIAQSTAGDQPEKMADFFVHNEFLLVDGRKMAKSDHNFYTLPDIVIKGFDPLDFRMLVLQSHYRNASNFTWENLTAAQNRRRNWRNAAELRWQTTDSDDDGQAEIINNLLDEATQALQNDLDTPAVLMLIDQAVDVLAKDPSNVDHFALNNLIKFIDDNLGLKLAETTPDITDEQKKLIAQRQTARAEKDFAKSDEIRDQLAKQGIEIKDSAVLGPIWSRRS